MAPALGPRLSELSREAMLYFCFCRGAIAVPFALLLPPSRGPPHVDAVSARGLGAAGGYGALFQAAGACPRPRMRPRTLSATPEAFEAESDRLHRSKAAERGVKRVRVGGGTQQLLRARGGRPAGAGRT